MQEMKKKEQEEKEQTVARPERRSQFSQPAQTAVQRRSTLRKSIEQPAPLRKKTTMFKEEEEVIAEQHSQEASSSQSLGSEKQIETVQKQNPATEKWDKQAFYSELTLEFDA